MGEKKTVTATEFKAKCLQLMDEVAATGEVIEITKRGNVVAELRAPYAPPRGLPPGFAKDELVILGDIISPIEDIPWYSEDDLFDGGKSDE